MKRSLRLGGRIDRYVTAHFVGSYALAAGLLVGLFIVLDAASNVEGWVDEAGPGPPATLLQVLRYYALNLPYIFLQVGPFVTVMAAMFTVSKLLAKNEVAPVFSAGVGAHRLLMPVYLGAVLMSVSMLGLREACGRWLSGPRDELIHRLKTRRSELEYRGVIVRNLDGSFAVIDRYSPRADGGPLAHGLTVKTRVGGHFTKIEAESARWDGVGWVLEGGLRTDLVNDELHTSPVSLLKEVELTPSLIEMYRRSRDAPLEMTMGEVATLLDREPDQPAWATLWHYFLTFSLANLILVLVGVPLMFSHERGRGAERLALGGMMCVFYFAFDFVLRTMGLHGFLSPVLAAWSPVLVFGVVGLFLTEAMHS